MKVNRRMKRWQRVVSVLAAIVVFVTTYSLVLPAITLDKETASTQAGIEVAASENEAEGDGTVFEAEPEEEPAAEEPRKKLRSRRAAKSPLNRRRQQLRERQRRCCARRGSKY